MLTAEQLQKFANSVNIWADAQYEIHQDTDGCIHFAYTHPDAKPRLYVLSPCGNALDGRELWLFKSVRIPNDQGAILTLSAPAIAGLLSAL